MGDTATILQLFIQSTRHTAYDSNNGHLREYHTPLAANMVSGHMGGGEGGGGGGGLSSVLVLAFDSFTVNTGIVILNYKTLTHTPSKRYNCPITLSCTIWRGCVRYSRYNSTDFNTKCVMKSHCHLSVPFYVARPDHAYQTSPK